jgi:hypothetical protein
MCFADPEDAAGAATTTGAEHSGIERNALDMNAIDPNMGATLS